MATFSVFRSRFFSGYYIANVVILAAYFALRELLPDKSALHKHDFTGIERESSMWFTLCAYLVVRYSRSPTVDAFFGTAFFFAKVATLVVLALCDWRFGAWYALVITAMWIAFPQKEYEGPEDITHLNHISFEQHVRGRRGANNAWLVEFYASWSPPCIQFAPLFAELSLEYTSEHLRFGKADVGRWEDLSLEFGISTSSASKQLPTLILFENGKEVARLPPIGSDDSSVNKQAPSTMSKKDIARYFQLDILKEGAHRTSSQEKGSLAKPSSSSSSSVHASSSASSAEASSSSSSAKRRRGKEK
ncbi:Thioredoxin-related transmembrane protein 2 [Balamuthia mandrillaris]